MSKGNRNNGKFAQDNIISQFSRDAKSSIAGSAVMAAKRNAKRKFVKKEEVRISFAKDVFNG